MIDAGDPASPPDPDGTRADIGAYPFETEAASLGPTPTPLASLVKVFFGWLF
jgi:hypothetical protein